MDSDYALSIRYEVYETLTQIRGTSKRKLLAWMETFQTNPCLEPDYTDKEPDGSQFAVKVVGRYAVFHYVDHAIKEVKIVRIRPAD